MSSYGFVKRSGGFGTLTIVSKAVRFATRPEMGKFQERLPSSSIAYQPCLIPRCRICFHDVIRDGHCGARTCMASPSMRRRGPWAMSDARASWHLLANQTLFEVSLCRPTAPGLPIWGTGDFGTSPIFGQLSDKPLLASICLLGVSERKAQWRIETLMRRGSGFFGAGVVARFRGQKTRRGPKIRKSMDRNTNEPALRRTYAMPAPQLLRAAG